MAPGGVHLIMNEEPGLHLNDLKFGYTNEVPAQREVVARP